MQKEVSSPPEKASTIGSAMVYLSLFSLRKPSSLRMKRF